jgi:hypothetical protein
MKKKFLGMFSKKQTLKQDSSTTSDEPELSKQEENILIVRQFIQSAKNKVSYTLFELASSDLLTFFNQENPEPEVLLLFQCCVALLAGRVPSDMVEVNKNFKPLSNNWASCRRMLIHPNFLDKIRDLKDVNFSIDEMEIVEKYSSGFNGLPEILKVISSYLCGLVECEKMFMNSVMELMKSS